MGRPLPTGTNGFAAGLTRVDTVVHELGPPNQASRLPDGFAFLYEYSRMSEFQLGFSLNLPVIRWLKFIKAWNYLDQQSLLLTFDQQGILRSVGSTSSEEGLGGGSAVQFLFMAMTLSDVSDFLRPANAHQWGEMLLQPPPITLNSAQSLRTGQYGMEQRTAPDYAGQHTLEMTVPKTEKEKRRIKKDYQWQP
jgi:hypothetical protein